MKYIAILTMVIFVLAVTTVASAQNVKTFKSNFPGFCPMPGPTTY